MMDADGWWEDCLFKTSGCAAHHGEALPSLVWLPLFRQPSHRCVTSEKVPPFEHRLFDIARPLTYRTSFTHTRY